MKSILALAFALTSTAALGQDFDDQIRDFRPDVFGNCLDRGEVEYLGEVSNPLSLLSSAVYETAILGPGGKVEQGLATEPLYLPIEISDAVDPDNHLCQMVLQANADGAINIFGLEIGAKKEDVYSVKLSLVSRQNVAPVAEDNTLVAPWRSDTYRRQFQGIAAELDGDDVFFIVNDVSIYLLQVEKYTKTSGGIFGAIFGSGGYARDHSFKGNKIVIGGDVTSLKAASYHPGGKYGPALPASPSPSILDSVTSGILAPPTPANVERPTRVMSSQSDRVVGVRTTQQLDRLREIEPEE